jgi:uptake hydrogenase large subunit
VTGALQPGTNRIGVETDAFARVASVELHSSRPAGLARLFVGRPAAEIPALAASLFGLCGFAHGAAARNAIAAARGEVASWKHDTPGLAAERLAESLRACVMEWPSASLDRASVTTPLREAMMTARALMAADHMFSRDERMLDSIEKAFLTCGLRPDTQELDGFFGAMMLEARAENFGSPQAPDALSPHDDAVVIHALRRQRTAFATAPVFPGRIVETGAFARHWREIMSESSMLAARLGARFVDMRETLRMLRRACAGKPDLACAAGQIGEGEGYAAVETARGRLYHWARLGSDGCVLDYEMLAPTEWNFHAEGPFAVALRSAEIGFGEIARRRVARLAALFDPCVAFDIHIYEPAHA